MINSGTVVAAMSGGVDSAVSAYLLKESGYNVIGITMRLSTPKTPDNTSQNKRCCTAEDTNDAKRVCRALGIPHYVLNFEKEFHGNVIQYFLDEYRLGRTPNPCIACNQHVKFRFLMDKVNALGADMLATGHYGRIVYKEGRYRLLKAIDNKKDQSYVLYGLGQKELSKLIFPVGEYPKKRIREIAMELGLPVADKPDSQDICFIPDGDYRKFIRNQIPRHPGEIVDMDGKSVGEHTGIEEFTVGQRKGLGIATGSKQYVVSLDAQTNKVTIGNSDDLNTQALIALKVSYVTGEQPEAETAVMAKVRHHAPESDANITPSGDEAHVWFREPQRAATPGQSVVFYKGEEVLGGGVIEKTLSPSEYRNQAHLVTNPSVTT